MRLTCPKCGAEYEVPDTVIPPEGLTVECSSCDSHWFQPGGRSDGTGTPTSGSEPMPQRQELDPAIADILREEARIEAELRAAEAASGTTRAPAEPKGSPKAVTAEKDAEKPAPSAADPTPSDTTMAASSAPPADAPVGMSGRFAGGFVMSVFCALSLILIYANAPQIAQRMPGADPLLSNFVATVDQARGWLDRAVRSAPAD